MRRILFLLLITTCSLCSSAESVKPLLDGWVRHQSAPFNNYCPHWTDKGTPSSERCVVGCVATALESIISYHQREIVLQDTLHGWVATNYTLTDVLPGTTLDTRLILPDYGDGTAASIEMDEREYLVAAETVARLSLWCGMAAQMNYGLDESGADVGNLVEPLKNIFGWKTAEYIDSYKYTPEQWKELLKNEIRNGRPVLYSGYTMNIAGHAFVLDGFNDKDEFHINWGYSGAYDENYYDITKLCPFEDPEDTTPLGSMEGFFCNQQALILSPDSIDMTLINDTLARTGKEIEVKSISMSSTAATNKYVPVTITLHNTADVALCSPFEIFSNLATDDKPFEQGDYGALFGVRMEPGETQTITIHCKFAQKGSRTVHLSPDDKEILGSKKVTFVSGSTDNLTFDTPEVTFPDATTATFSIPVTNNSSETSGSKVTYCMMPDAETTGTDYRHYDYLYIPAGNNSIETVTFKNLEPGSTHCLLIRCPWKIQQQFVFTQGQHVDGISETLAENYSDGYYNLQGQRVVYPAQHGILIHNGKKILK